MSATRQLLQSPAFGVATAIVSPSLTSFYLPRRVMGSGVSGFHGVAMGQAR